MGDLLRLEVVWPDDRTVRVEVEFEPPVADLARAEVQALRGVPSLVGIDPDDMASPTAILEFLSEATRAEANGNLVRVSCWANEEARLYKALDITASDPQPIKIKIDAHGG